MEKTMNEKGFTLIELMIVIAIIGILAAIAIPQMSAYRDRAYNASALSDCRNLITALEAYHIDYGQYPMDSEQSGSTTWNSLSENGDLTVLLKPYGFKLSAGVRATSVICDYQNYQIVEMGNDRVDESSRVLYTYDSADGEIITNIPGQVEP